MTGQPDHLTDEAGAVLTESIDERVYFVRSKRWIAYPKAVEILGHLNALLKHPRTTRMPSLAVYGDSGMGKSMLVEKFKDDYARAPAIGPTGRRRNCWSWNWRVDRTSGGFTRRSSLSSARRRTRARQSSSWSERQSAFLATSACKSWSWTRSITFSQRPGGNNASSSIRCAT